MAGCGFQDTWSSSDFQQVQGSQKDGNAELRVSGAALAGVGAVTLRGRVQVDSSTQLLSLVTYAHDPQDAGYWFRAALSDDQETLTVRVLRSLPDGGPGSELGDGGYTGGRHF